jgi:hypothetical protein
MQYILLQALCYAFLLQLQHLVFLQHMHCSLLSSAIFFADFTTSSSNNFDLSAIYTSTNSLISLWLVFYYCLSVCPVMGIGISPLYQSKTYECNTDISVANELKDQLSLTLIDDSAEIDNVGVIFPEGGIGEEGEKCVKVLSFRTYGIK